MQQGSPISYRGNWNPMDAWFQVKMRFDFFRGGIKFPRERMPSIPFDISTARRFEELGLVLDFETCSPCISRFTTLQVWKIRLCEMYIFCHSISVAFVDPKLQSRSLLFVPSS
jgi:hypothetical protein